MPGAMQFERWRMDAERWEGARGGSGAGFHAARPSGQAGAAAESARPRDGGAVLLSEGRDTRVHARGACLPGQLRPLHRRRRGGRGHQLGLSAVAPPLRDTPETTVPAFERPGRHGPAAIWRREDARDSTRARHVCDRPGGGGAPHLFLAASRHAAQRGGAGGPAVAQPCSDLTNGHSTPAIASVTRRARTIPSAPSVFSYHSVARCASPALPPPPSAMAGMPRAIGTLASVDALASSASRPSTRFAATAASTSGWVRGVTPDGRDRKSTR